MQVVKIEDSLSEPKPLKAGVPKGSILGPVLFTLYVNDLLQVPKRCRALGYVDDTKVFMALPSSQLPEICPEIHTTTKMAKMAKCRQQQLGDQCK